MRRASNIPTPASAHRSSRRFPARPSCRSSTTQVPDAPALPLAVPNCIHPIDNYRTSPISIGANHHFWSLGMPSRPLGSLTGPQAGRPRRRGKVIINRSFRAVARFLSGSRRLAGARARRCAELDSASGTSLAAGRTERGRWHCRGPSRNRSRYRWLAYLALASANLVVDMNDGKPGVRVGRSALGSRPEPSTRKSLVPTRTGQEIRRMISVDWDDIKVRIGGP